MVKVLVIFQEMALSIWDMEIRLSTFGKFQNLELSKFSPPSLFWKFKEEVTKFLVSLHHARKLWLHEPIEITIDLISYIIVLSITDDVVPMGSKNSSLIKEFTRNKVGENSKGIVIIQI